MINELSNSLDAIAQQTLQNSYTLGIILLIPWVMYVLILCTNKALLLLGILPRHLIGLPGIVLAPLLHANFNHLFFNSIPLLVLSNFILMNGLPYFLEVTLLITLLSGLAIWCFGKPALHVGASGLITGYWGFLVSNMYQHFNITTLILGLISLYYFAGLFLGVFPSQKGVSWEGHLFGLLAGIAVSYWMQ